MKIKLIAQAFKKPDGSIIAFVAPKFIKATDKLYQVNDVYNGVTLKTAFSEDQFFVGKGAGAYPTASAVISDLSALTYDYRYEYKKIRSNDHVPYSDDVLLKAFVRFDAADKAFVSDRFEEIEEQFSNASASYIIGEIALTEYIKLHENTSTSAILISVINAEVGDKFDIDELVAETELSDIA